jgi:hypothetical protein
MATVLNTANCAITANTGLVTCATTPDIVSYAIAVPKGFVFDAADLADAATFNAALAAKTVANTGRAYILPFLTNFTDNTGDPVTTNRNNYVAGVQNKPYNWRYLMNGSFCLFQEVKQLLKFNFFDFLFVDAMGTVWGTEANDSAGDPSLGGIQMFEVWVEDWMQKKPDDVNAYPINFRVLDNRQLNENVAFAPTNFTVNMATMGLANVQLYAGTTASTATHLYVSGKYVCGGASLGETFGSTLAATGAWTVFTSAGVSVTVSAVSYNSILDQYDLTITSTPATTVIVGLAAPATLTGTPYFAYVVTETPNKYTLTTP